MSSRTSIPNHDTELEEILEDFGYSIVNNPDTPRAELSSVAKAALHTYLYKQTLELIGEDKHSGIHGVLGWNLTSCPECRNRQLRKAAAERWGQE